MNTGGENGSSKTWMERLADVLSRSLRWAECDSNYTQSLSHSQLPLQTKRNEAPSFSRPKSLLRICLIVDIILWTAKGWQGAIFHKLYWDASFQCRIYQTMQGLDNLTMAKIPKSSAVRMLPNWWVKIRENLSNSDHGTKHGRSIHLISENTRSTYVLFISGPTYPTRSSEDCQMGFFDYKLESLWLCWLCWSLFPKTSLLQSTLYRHTAHLCQETDVVASALVLLCLPLDKKLWMA